MVDRLERELDGQAQVVRLDVFGKVGGELAKQYNVASMPTFLVFDGDGTLLARQVGIPDRVRIKALVTDAAAQAEQASA
jgi:thioredoxin-related protein